MRDRFFVLFSVLFLLGIVFVACSSDDASSPTLLDKQWVLVSYKTESNEVLKETEGYYYLITFHSDGTYSGKVYGNEMEGEYVCKGNKIKISCAYITKVYYEGADPDVFFQEHLSDVYFYTVTDTELRLYYSVDQYFKFRIKSDQL